MRRGHFGPSLPRTQSPEPSGKSSASRQGRGRLTVPSAAAEGDVCQSLSSVPAVVRRGGIEEPGARIERIRQMFADLNLVPERCY